MGSLIPERSCGRIVFSWGNFLWWLLFPYLFHPPQCYHNITRPWSLCQNWRWQVTAKHPYALHSLNLYFRIDKQAGRHIDERKKRLQWSSVAFTVYHTSNMDQLHKNVLEIAAAFVLYCFFSSTSWGNKAQNPPGMKVRWLLALVLPA